ncbi:MAG: hypothetical protein M9938_03065 [Solirubrobacterales bacterium]|nr:hypothetical protein [Solirubrobacterales bacterium]
MTPIDIQQLMASKQALLAAELGLRDGLGHPVARGDVNEKGWERALERFLPGRYQVSRGAFVIDAAGGESLEVDLVIHDNYFHPELFEAADRCLIPAESVYAIFEVKPELSAEYVAYAIERARSVRALHRTNLPIVDARGKIGTPREPLRILAGILTVGSSWNPPFGQALENALGEADSNGELDFGCGLQHGAFEVTYPRGDDDQLMIDQLKIHQSDAASGLIFFLSRLFTRLQESGSVPAIDLREYSQKLEGNVDPDREESHQ